MIITLVAVAGAGIMLHVQGRRLSTLLPAPPPAALPALLRSARVPAPRRPIDGGTRRYVLHAASN